MEVKLYFTPNCEWCEKMKTWLKKKKVSFESLDLSESDHARDSLLEKTGQLAVPALEVDEKMIIGFDEKVLEELFKKSK